MKTHIATIFSRVHEQEDKYGFREGGFHSLDVNVSMEEATASGDAKDFVRTQIATHLAGCVASTGIPLNEGMWNIEFSVFAQTFFHYPSGFTV